MRLLFILLLLLTKTFVIAVPPPSRSPKQQTASQSTRNPIGNAVQSRGRVSGEKTPSGSNAQGKKSALKSGKSVPKTRTVGGQVSYAPGTRQSSPSGSVGNAPARSNDSFQRENRRTSTSTHSAGSPRLRGGRESSPQSRGSTPARSQNPAALSSGNSGARQQISPAAVVGPSASPGSKKPKNPRSISWRETWGKGPMLPKEPPRPPMKKPSEINRMSAQDREAHFQMEKNHARFRMNMQQKERRARLKEETGRRRTFDEEIKDAVRTGNARYAKDPVAWEKELNEKHAKAVEERDSKRQRTSSGVAVQQPLQAPLMTNPRQQQPIRQSSPQSTGVSGQSRSAQQTSRQPMAVSGQPRLSQQPLQRPAPIAQQLQPAVQLPQNIHRPQQSLTRTQSTRQDQIPRQQQGRQQDQLQYQQQQQLAGLMSRPPPPLSAAQVAQQLLQQHMYQRQQVQQQQLLHTHQQIYHHQQLQQQLLLQHQQFQQQQIFQYQQQLLQQQRNAPPPQTSPRVAEQNLSSSGRGISRHQTTEESSSDSSRRRQARPR